MTLTLPATTLPRRAAPAPGRVAGVPAIAPSLPRPKHVRTEEGGTLGDGMEETVELVRRYQLGEPAAGELLFARWLPRVRRLVQLRLGRELAQRVDVDDVAQETLLAALQSLDRFELREEARWVHWLARTAEHRVHQALRAEQRTPVASGFDPLAESTQVPDKVARSEERALIERCLQRLSPAHRDVLLLREFAGCSWQGVAEELGHPSPNAAMKHYARARAALAAERTRCLRAAAHGTPPRPA